MPTWSGGIADTFAFYSDLYRGLYVDLTTDLDAHPELTTTYRYVSHTSPSTTSLTYPVSSDRVFMSMYNTALSINGVIIPSSALSPMYLNFSDSNGSATLVSVSCRIYGCYVLDASDWRHYMVPCLRVSDGREGLYDVVDGVFSAILIPNTITNESGTMTATYPVASDLTVTLGRGNTSSVSVTFPKGTSSVSLGSGYKYYTVSAITPSVDDLYYYEAGTY